MGITACVERERYDADPSDRLLKSRMVHSYLRHRRFPQESALPDDSDSGELAISNFVKGMNDPSDLSLQSTPVSINKSLLEEVQKRVERMSRKPIVYQIDPEDYQSIFPASLIHLARNPIMTTNNHFPGEPRKIDVLKQSEGNSIDDASTKIPQILSMPPLESVGINSIPEDLPKVSIYTKESSIDIQTTILSDYVFQQLKSMNKIGVESTEPMFPVNIQRVSSPDPSPRPSLAANVFSKHHKLRDNPSPLRLLPSLLNHKGKLNHDDEMRVSNNPQEVKALLREVIHIK